MRRIFGAALMSLFMAPGAGLAQALCDDLWFTRNAIADRAGYCFETPLGQAIFDNEGCTGTGVTLGAEESARVAALRAREARAGCTVDTERATLDLPDLSLRLRMRDLPEVDEVESACLAYRGQRRFLYAGTDQGARVLGSVEPGDRLLSSHLVSEDATGRVWSYLTVRPQGSDRVAVAGWSSRDLFAACESVAG